MIKDKSSVFIDPKARIGDNVILCQNVHIEGESVIGENVTVFPNTYISNSIIGKGTKIYSSIVDKTVTGSCCLIGPFAHLKRGTVLGNQVYVGSFVNIKNAEVGDYSKIQSLSSVVDVKIDDSVVIEPNVIFVSHAESKFSVVGKDSVIQSGSKIYAPCKIQAKSLVEAGSVIKGNNVKSK